MRILLKIIFIFFFIAGAAAMVVNFNSHQGCKIQESLLYRPAKKTPEEFDRLKITAGSLRKFILQKHFNDRICFMIDMNLPSGMNRFFVYDLQNDSVLISGLVAHGSCDSGFQPDPVFSNKANSGCSCTGRFRIAGSYNGKFGLAYKLYGLDSTNDHAFERNIVLHSYKCVPEKETYPFPICNSRGCPMVSPVFFEQLKSFIDDSHQPILLTIFK